MRAQGHARALSSWTKLQRQPSCCSCSRHAYSFAASQSSGVTSVTLLGTGDYDVEFNQNVRDCAYVAGGGEAGSTLSGNPAFYNATGRASSVDGVFVDTRNDTGSTTDESYYLAVFC